MSAQSPPSAPGCTSEIVDLAEGMSDLDVDQESGMEENDNEDTKDARKPHKKKRNRASRRTTKAKKAKELEALKKSQEWKVDAKVSIEGTFSLSK